MSLGGTGLLGADIPHAEPTRSVYMSLDLDSDSEADRIYGALTQGGEVLMKMQETFFATRFAQVRDRFGISWMIIHQKPGRPGA
jgi:PhnB protein